MNTIPNIPALTSTGNALVCAAAAVCAALLACGEGEPLAASAPDAEPTEQSSPAPAPTPSETAVVLPVPAPTTTPATVEPAPTPEPGPGSLPRLEVEPAFPNVTLGRMVHLTYPPGGGGRLYLVLQPGLIVSFEDRQDVEALGIFLDIRERVNDQGNEEGCSGWPSIPATSPTATSTSTTRRPAQGGR